MKIDAILFDMDGVLIDSEEYICTAAIEGLKKYGVESKPEDYIPFMGAGENRYVGGVSEKYGVPFDPKMKDVVYEIYAEIIKKHPEAVYDGVLDVIKDVMRGHRACVCSAADRTKVCHNLNAIGVTDDFFTALVTGSDVTRQKPYPDIFLKGAELCGVDIKKCIAIDDTINGVKAIVASGAVSVAITTSFDEETLRREAKPDYVINDIREFPALIRKIESL